MKALIAAAIVASVLAPAAQSATAISGAWSGTLTIKHDGKITDEVDVVHAVLKQNGAELTGTAGPDTENQYRITKGKVATADAVTTVTFEFIANGAHSAYILKLVDGVLRGEARVEGEDGQPRTAVVELKVAKQ